MKPKKAGAMEIDLVLSGSGMLFPCHIGAYAYLVEQGVTIKRVAGTSGGSIVAAGIAHDWTPDRALALAKDMASKPLLDANWLLWRGTGLFKGDRIHDILREHLPGNMTMSNKRWGAFVVDVWTRQGFFVSSHHHETSMNTISGSDLSTADVVRASISIPFWFKMTKLRNRPQIDGGVKLNFGMGIWDDEANRPTIGIRFKSTEGKERKIKGVTETVAAVVSMLTDNANHTYVSKKRWPFVIEIESKGDSMDFDIDEEWVQRRFNEGWAAAKRKWPKIKEKICETF
jgi:NTE family protein